ncbi:S24 family peptidase [Acidomonas methanolica]|nr:S24 family peptidase [Acidomonas methanolica]GBQ52862.1 S24 family peptidase [Acidomonas methanolica]
MPDFPVPVPNWEELGGPERVRIAVEKGGGYTAVVRNSGISQSSLNEYLKGRTLRVDTALRLAAACDVSPQWLIFGVADIDSPRLGDSSPEGVLVRVYDEAEASAGHGSLGLDTPQPRQVSISRHFLEDLGLQPKHTIILKVRGDSMEPTLATGDRVLVDTSPRRMLAAVTLFVSNGMLMVKRLSPTATGTIKIISDNNRYPPEEIPITKFRWGQPDDDDTITIIGRVAYRLQALS